MEEQIGNFEKTAVRLIQWFSDIYYEYRFRSNRWRFYVGNINAKEENKFYKDAFEKTTSDRRQKVLEVAINEFAAKGYNATNINDIIRNSNISTGAMYSYFASKEDLFLTIVNNAYALLEAAYEDIMPISKDF